MMVTKINNMPAFICTLICFFLVIAFYRQYLFIFFPSSRLGMLLLRLPAISCWWMTTCCGWLKKKTKPAPGLYDVWNRLQVKYWPARFKWYQRYFKKLKNILQDFFSWILFARPKYFLNITNDIKKWFSLISFIYCDNIVFTRISF